jgi:hypothetical protein
MTESHSEIAPPIAGVERVVERFGRWPSLHDAEVVRLVLDRAGRGGPGPTVTMAVYVYETDGRVEPDGRCALRHETLATFEFEGVSELTVADFNHQNVIWALAIEEVSAEQLEEVRYRVELSASFGVAAAFSCRDARVVDVQPWSWGRNFESGEGAV